jgi:Family of unknown function (DUF6339)
MRYLALKPANALESLEALRRAEAVDESRVLESRGSGTDISEHVALLQKTISAIKAGYPQELRSRRDPVGGQFEVAACSEVHKGLPFDPDMLADQGFWSWLAVFEFRHLVEWRHGGESGIAVPANFGIGSGSENLLYRMWLRADVGYDQSRNDPYELALRGDQDFWRSHIFRQGYGRCRTLARALVRYQFPDDSEAPKLKIKVVRELAKRLRKLHPNLVFDFLSEEDAGGLIEREAECAIRELSENTENDDNRIISA